MCPVYDTAGRIGGQLQSPGYACSGVRRIVGNAPMVHRVIPNLCMSQDLDWDLIRLVNSVTWL